MISEHEIGKQSNLGVIGDANSSDGPFMLHPFVRRCVLESIQHWSQKQINTPSSSYITLKQQRWHQHKKKCELTYVRTSGKASRERKRRVEMMRLRGAWDFECIGSRSPDSERHYVVCVYCLVRKRGQYNWNRGYILSWMNGGQRMPHPHVPLHDLLNDFMPYIFNNNIVT